MRLKLTKASTIVGSLSGLQYSAAVAKNDKVVDESSLLQHMKQTMQMNIKAKSYQNAIFFADKIVNLVRSSEPNLSHSPANSSSN